MINAMFLQGVPQGLVLAGSNIHLISWTNGSQPRILMACMIGLCWCSIPATHDKWNNVYKYNFPYGVYIWKSDMIMLIFGTVTNANICCMKHCFNTLRQRKKMAAISLTTFSNAFSLKKMYEFRLKCHWCLFLRVQLTIFHHWTRRQAIIWTNDG